MKRVVVAIGLAASTVLTSGRASADWVQKTEWGPYSYYNIATKRVEFKWGFVPRWVWREPAQPIRPTVPGHVLESPRSETTKLLGSWASKTANGVCTFYADGTVRESDGAVGRYSYADGRLSIRWASGLMESGSIEFLGGDSFRYRITSYSDDPRRVGKTFFYQLNR